MAETNISRLPLDIIKDKRSYEEHQREFKKYFDEMKDFLSHPDIAARLTLQAVEKNMEELKDVETGSKREEELLGELLVLNVKSNLLKEGSYQSEIMNHLIAEKFMLDEYELKWKFPTSMSLIRGMFDKENREDAKKLVGLTLIRLSGKIAMPTSLEYIPSEQLIEEVLKNYEPVDIDAQELRDKINEEKEIKALVPYQEIDLSGYAEQTRLLLTQEVTDLLKNAPEDVNYKQTIYPFEHGDLNNVTANEDRVIRKDNKGKEDLKER